LQTTIKSPVLFEGVGLHSGEPVAMTVHAASANHGIWFRRTDVVGADPLVPARWDAVNPTPLCTKIENQEDLGWARLEPARNLSIDFAIEFEDAAIGSQSKTLNMANGTFVRELCDSRTFCRNSDVEAMYAQGLAKGGTLENAVVVDGDQVLSPGGLRHADEAVRHKMLDALGDLSLAGAPILGRYIGMRAGHSMTNALLRALFADPTAYETVDCDASINAHLPGAGVTRGEIPAAH